MSQRDKKETSKMINCRLTKYYLPDRQHQARTIDPQQQYSIGASPGQLKRLLKDQPQARRPP